MEDEDDPELVRQHLLPPDLLQQLRSARSEQAALAAQAQQAQHDASSAGAEQPAAAGGGEPRAGMLAAATGRWMEKLGHLSGALLSPRGSAQSKLSLVSWLWVRVLARLRMLQSQGLLRQHTTHACVQGPPCSCCCGLEARAVCLPEAPVSCLGLQAEDIEQPAEGAAAGEPLQRSASEAKSRLGSTGGSSSRRAPSRRGLETTRSRKGSLGPSGGSGSLGLPLGLGSFMQRQLQQQPLSSRAGDLSKAHLLADRERHFLETELRVGWGCFAQVGWLLGGCSAAAAAEPNA